MAPEARPAFLFYPADFLSDMGSAMMPLEVRGGYITLLSHAWIERGLPEEEAAIAQLLKLRPREFARVWPALLKRFQLQGGRLINPRLEAERQRQDLEERELREEETRAREQRRQAALQRWRHPKAGGF